MRAALPYCCWMPLALLAGWLWGAGAVLARPVEITILHTTDIHGNLLPTSDYEGNQEVGGLLRCATRIEQIRAGKEHVLLVDSGDLIQGSAVSYLTQGRSTIRAMEYLRYDAWTFGNHEFDWGLSPLLALHNDTTLPMLGANIVGRPGQANPLTRLKPFIVREVDGVKVVVVGLITPGVPTWSTPDLLGDALFERSLSALRRIMPQVQAENPDILLLTTHQGYRPYGDDHANEVNAIAQAYPEFDAILGGHSHQAVEKALVGGRTLYSQAGYYGIWLGQLDLTFDTVTRRLVQKQARLHRIDSGVPMHTGLMAVVEQDLAASRAYLEQDVGEAAAPLTERSDALGRSDVQRLICRALAEATGADLVLHGVLDEESLPAGALRMNDVWRIVPYENRAAIITVTVGELAEILNENLSNRGSLQFMGPYGFTYATEGQGAAQQATRIRLADGTIPHPRQRLKLCVNSYVVASGGKRFPRLREIAEQPESRLRLLDVQTREAVVSYLKAHRGLTPEFLKQGEP